MKFITDFIKKNGSTILSVFEVTGVVMTSLFFGKAGFDYAKKVDDDAEIKDKVVEGIKIFSPAIGMAAATMACIIGGNSYLNNTNLAIAGAYASIDQMYKAYKNRVIDKYGIEAHNDIINDIMVEKAEDMHITYETTWENELTLDVDSKNEPMRTFYDSFSNRYFESKLSKVLQAEYNLNRNYVLRGETPLEEYYEFLGLDYNVPDDVELYWDAYKAEFPWIDFNHTLYTLDDGMEIIAIDMMMFPEDRDENSFY